MSPETLLGMDWGKSVLQRLLGQGTMGAVYLAYQPDVQRQVAVKVFLAASTLDEAEQVEFLQRLQQEIALSATLEHSHILAILDHGMQRDLVYEVMPYIRGESLQVHLEQRGILSFAQAQSYLEQLASALDYAHTRNILHRDIKASNILLDQEGHLLLTDFGVAGLTTEKNFARMRQVQPGMLNYMAPEYILGKTIDRRADLYSLGVVLYQMVTGIAPFQGHSLSETAMKHMQAAPPAPRSLRPDLPQAAEQVILRALAKQPTDRYVHARDLASAFRLALEAEQLLPTTETGENQPTDALALLSDLASGGATAKIPRISAPRKSSLFNPKWQTIAAAEQKPVGLPSRSNTLVPPTPVLPAYDYDTADSPLTLEQKPGDTAAELTLTTQAKKQEAPPGQNTTGALQAFPTLPASGENTGTIKLTEPVKIVQLPVAGQPGRFVTGLLPALSPEQDTKASVRGPGKRLKIASFALALLIVVTGSFAFFSWLSHNPGRQVAQKTATPADHANLNASATARATATAGSNIILADNLSQNIHNWPVGQQGNFTYAFSDGAYDITNNDQQRSAPVILPAQVLNGPFAYSLTMEQLKGDDTSLNNQFGMILDASLQNVNNKQVDKFYAFEVLNTADGEYQFWKYDNSQSDTDTWTKLWSQSPGKEFLQGNGPAHKNTFKIVADATTFTFLVNGQQVGTLKDSSFSSGEIGMLVNLDGAEVAFSNLLLTKS